MRFIVSMLFAALSLAAQTQTGGDPAQTAPPTGAPQTAPATGPPQSAPAPAPARKQPSAKTQEEYNAYQAIANQPDLKIAAKLASDFASRFADSDLREPLFQTLMLKHQAANQGDQALAYAEKVLLINPQNTVALVSAANVLSERTTPGSADSEQRFDHGLRYAERAIANIDTGLLISNEATPEQLSALKGTLLALAHSAEGNIYLLRKNFADAEKHLALAAAASPNPNALILYRLALAQHGLKRFDDALDNVNKAVEAANTSHDLLLLEKAKQEKTTLVKAGARR